MPIYEYACPHCGHVFEKLVLTSNHDLPVCPQCGEERVEQKFSTFATGGARKSSAPACAPAGGG